MVWDSKKKTISLSIVEIFLDAYCTSKYCTASEKTTFDLNSMYFYSLKVALCWKEEKSGGKIDARRLAALQSGEMFDEQIS